MRILVVGVNHATGPLRVRERMAVPAGELRSALARLKSVVREGFIVSTCNRTEAYGLTSGGQPAAGVEMLLGFLAAQSATDISIVRSACYAHAHDAAVRHLLRVTSGLDSMVLGEDQIQGQVKRAIAVAREAGMLGATFERLGSAALACGKRVRTFTGIGRHAVSLESLAVRAAVERLGALAVRHVLVVGAGEAASLIVRHLTSAGATDITIVSRSLARARGLARTADAAARRWSELPDALVEADAVFSCTSAPRPVITPAVFERRSSRRGADALLCLDLGMPRDVDAAVASMPGVSLLTLDELARMAAAHRAARRAHVPAAEDIVRAEAERFLEWLDTRRAVAAIA